MTLSDKATDAGRSECRCWRCANNLPCYRAEAFGRRALSVSDRAVRKASRERLLRDFARAARNVAALCGSGPCALGRGAAEYVLQDAFNETSRTRYACLMTAWGL